MNKVRFCYVFIFANILLISFALNCVNDKQKQHFSEINKSAQDWRDNLGSLSQYASAVKIYSENGDQGGDVDINKMYEVLGLQANATIEQIKKAYRKESLKTHPDKLIFIPDSPEKTAAKSRFEEINNAYTVLTNQDLKQAYEIISSRENRLDFSKVEISEILSALEIATKMVEEIQMRLEMFESNNLKKTDVDSLNKILKTLHAELCEISKGEITIDGQSVEEQIRSWSKSMLANINYLVDNVKEQESKLPKSSKILAIERTDPEYVAWLYENKSNPISSVHAQNRIPLQEAIFAGSAMMIKNILDAAAEHGIKIKTLLQPFKDEYAALMVQGKKTEAKDLLDKVCSFNIRSLSDEMMAIAQKIDKLNPAKK